MDSRMVGVINAAIYDVVDDFQCESARERYWNERDIHLDLFYRLKTRGVVSERYVTELIRAEFPTLNGSHEAESEMGRYDLVILDPMVYDAIRAGTNLQTTWYEFLGKITLVAAVEIKIWQGSFQFDSELVARDMGKLTQERPKVQNAFFLNFVGPEFNPVNREFYNEFRALLGHMKNQNPQVNVLCVPRNRSLQPDPNDNWL